MNSTNCMVFSGVGLWLVGPMPVGAQRIHRTSGLGKDVHVHVAVGHVHCSSHHGIVMSWGWQC